VGYGSSRAFYAKTGKRLGITPSVYRRGGNRIRVSYEITDSALGSVLVAGTDQGICVVLVGEDEDLLLRELREELPGAVFKHESSPKWKAAVKSCHDEAPLLSKLPVSLRGRVFQARVWNSLQ
jgi:AraC family transcriptional regulator of adaptative response/methylated-DNA-[protein]-cysteine methyltransferase